MEDREYEVMDAVEERHFWFVGTRGIVRDAFLAAGIPATAKVLDMGCGTGGTMRALAGLAVFTGLDMSPLAADFAHRKTGNPVLAGSATALPFADGTFDAALALDVLEHIEDHDRAVAEVRRVVRPGGALIATVPCHPSLYGEHDRALHHVRRYRRAEFLDLLARNGFRPERVTWTNSLLFPVAAAHRVLSKALPHRQGPDRSDAAARIGPLNGLFTAVMGIERRFLRRGDLPFGLGLLVVAR